MQRIRSNSAPPAPGRPDAPSTRPDAISEVIPGVIRLGIRILGLRSVPLAGAARQASLLACAGELRRLPQSYARLLVEELADACATLPAQQQIAALEAVFKFQKPSP